MTSRGQNKALVIPSPIAVIPSPFTVIPSEAEGPETADGSDGAIQTTTGFSKSRIIRHPSYENSPAQSPFRLTGLLFRLTGDTRYPRRSAGETPIRPAGM